MINIVFKYTDNSVIIQKDLKYIILKGGLVMFFIIQLVLIICPGIMAAHFYEAKESREKSVQVMLYDISKFTLWIFGLGMLVVAVREGENFNWTYFAPSWIAKYVAITTVLAFVVPLINIWVNKQFPKSSKDV